MKTLSRKLLRTIKSTWGQFIALAIIVMLGMLIYISMSTVYNNLAYSQQTFYRENNFADYNFHVVKAPASVIKRVETVPGVVRATGRIQKDVSIIKPGNERATGRLTSYKLPMEREVNRLHLLNGRMLESESANDILLDPGYAEASGLEPGDSIEIIAEGKKIPLYLAGTATSPEFIYPMRDAASLMPEAGTFAIIMMEKNQAEEILNLKGQINQVVVQLAPGADQEKVKKSVEEILEPYGNIASYPRKNQLSHNVLQAELDQLQIVVRSMPLIFFLIAAGIQFIILSRLIKSQRLQIGVMKAIGYDDFRIISLYTGYALSVSIVGAILGIGTGILSASAMSDIYAQYFNLPQTIGGINGKVVLYSILMSLILGFGSGFLASRAVIKINPAEAMRAETPAGGRRIILERWNWLWKRLDSSWKMSLRSIFRNRIRFAVTVLGVVSAVVILVLASFFNDAIDYMMKQNFKEVNRYDYMIRFSNPINYREILYWSQWDEIQKVEPVLEIPVKITYKEHSEDDLLVGMEPSTTMKGVFNRQGQRLSIPEDGVLISERTANKLGIQVGDKIKAETKMGIGPSQTVYLTVLGKNDQLMGQGAFISLKTANRILEESQVISGVMLKIDPGSGHLLEKRLNDITGVSSVLSLEKEQRNYETLLDSSMAFIWIMMFLGGLLGLVIVYNSSIMTFNERKRELASLKIMGFSQREVSGILAKETWIQAITGIIIGLPAGKGLGAAYVASVNTDLFSFPAVIYPRTYIISALAAFIFVLIGLWFVVRRVKDLDMLEVLKNRD